MARIFKLIREEARRVLPAVIYFFVAFNLFRLTYGQMLIHAGLHPANFRTTIIWAIIIGKIMIVVDHLPILNLFPNKPLIYNTVWRTSVYFIACFIIRLVDHLVPFIVKHQDLVVAFRQLWQGIWWARFWTIQIWCAILLFLFVVFQEIVKGVGRDKLRMMFFGR